LLVGEASAFNIVGFITDFIEESVFDVIMLGVIAHFIVAGRLVV